MTPGNRAKTASMHQKQPPPKSAISILFMLMESFVRFFRLVQMFARRQIGVFFEMFRPQRLGNGVFAAKPFAEVNQFATLGAKRPEFSREPVAALPARGTFYERIISFHPPPP